MLKNGITGQDSTQGNPFPQLAIGEYRVISSNYKAEFDQVSSVAITAITKSGTNEFHGEGFIDFTNQELRDRMPSEIFPATSDKIRNQGHAVRRRAGRPDHPRCAALFRDLRREAPHQRARRHPRPRSAGRAFSRRNIRAIFGPRNETFNENLYFGKINFTPTSNDLFEVSVKYRDESGEQFNNGINAFDTRDAGKRSRNGAASRVGSTPQTHWVNDFKVAYEDVIWNPRPVQFGNVSRFNATVPGQPARQRRGAATSCVIGAGSNFQDKGQKGWQISDDFTYTGLEGHTIKVGVKAKWVKLNTNTAERRQSALHL